MIKRKPIILVTSFSDDDSRGEDFERFCVKRPYIECLHDFGAIPVVAPFQTEEESLHALAQMADGLLIPGGFDMYPKRYGVEDIHQNSGPFSYERDEMEIELIKIFIAFRKPIFGICRGMQAVNVALGGTLYQDIASELDTSVRHHHDGSVSAIKRHAEDAHEAYFIEDTALAGFFASEKIGEKITVNSLHHQAVKEIAENLRVCAIGEDGIVEAIESKDMKTNWILGVQWHPESAVKNHPEQIVLFQKFIEASHAPSPAHGTSLSFDGNAV